MEVGGFGVPIPNVQEIVGMGFRAESESATVLTPLMGV